MRTSTTCLLALACLAPSAFAWAEATVDLSIVSLATDPERPLEGEPFRLVAIVRNVGSGDLERHVLVGFSIGGVSLGETRLEASGRDPLVAGDTAMVVSPTSAALPFGWPGAIAEVDSRDRILESDESNNAAEAKVPVSVPIVTFANPAPGEPYHDARTLATSTTFDDVFATIDCSAPSLLATSAAGRQGWHLETCAQGQRERANSYAFLAGVYTIAFATEGSSGATLYGVPHDDPTPEPHP